MLGARSCWRLNEDNQVNVHGFETPVKFSCVRAIPVPEVPSPRWAISDTEIAYRCRATSKDISKEVAMAKPTTKNDDQPMIRHIFSKEQMRTHNGPAGEDIERRAYELYLARSRADGYALEDWLQAE
jgi:Protein of unknown function (DUF2934)